MAKPTQAYQELGCFWGFQPSGCPSLEGVAPPDVERWYRHRRKRSVASADINLRNLLRSVHLYGGKVPADLLKMKQAALDDYMQDLIDFFEAQGLAGSTTKKYVEAIKSYLKWHRRKIMRPLH